jgi:hypothetical protein
MIAPRSAGAEGEKCLTGQDSQHRAGGRHASFRRLVFLSFYRPDHHAIRRASGPQAANFSAAQAFILSICKDIN